MNSYHKDIFKVLLKDDLIKHFDSFEGEKQGLEKSIEEFFSVKIVKNTLVKKIDVRLEHGILGEEDNVDLQESLMAFVKNIMKKKMIGG